VKTGVQAVLKGLKILDSGFRRNDGEKPQANFFTPSGGREGGGDVFNVFLATFRIRIRKNSEGGRKTG